MQHKDCINYVNGYCVLHGIPVPPNGQACPQFQPKQMHPPIYRMWQGPRWIPPPMPMHRPRRMRIRMRRRLRRGWGWINR
mgnify:CR=1 FL=1